VTLTRHGACGTGGCHRHAEAALPARAGLRPHRVPARTRRQTVTVRPRWRLLEGQSARAKLEAAL